LRRREQKAVKRLAELTAKYVAEGMSEADAKKRAQEEVRENPRKDWRAG
jgi:uncharacterized protein YoaH (UPF0181 family)